MQIFTFLTVPEHQILEDMTDPEVPSPSVIFWDVGKDTNWDRPVSKR